MCLVNILPFLRKWTGCGYSIVSGLELIGLELEMVYISSTQPVWKTGMSTCFLKLVFSWQKMEDDQSAWA